LNDLGVVNLNLGKNNNVRYLSLLVFTLTASYCFADTLNINFTNLPTVHESQTYSQNNATYNGEVTATIDGIPMQEIVCDDFFVDTPVPSTLTYNYSTFGGANWQSKVQFEGSETLVNKSGSALDGIAKNSSLTLTETEAYETAAVLLTGLESLNPHTQAHQVTDYQYALWYLFDQNVSLPQPVSSYYGDFKDLFDAATLVKSNLASDKLTVATDASKLVIYTYPNGSKQEFLGLSTPTPEPASWAMMAGFGLLGLIPGVRRKLRGVKSRA
jgi:hypothetical protein